MIRDLVKDWTTKPEIVTGVEAKWQAFAEADAAMAASGTVVLELALTGVPRISAYKTDWIIKLMTSKIKTWSAAPSEPDRGLHCRARIYQRGGPRRQPCTLDGDSFRQIPCRRRAMMERLDVLWRTDARREKPPGEHAAEIVLDVPPLKKKKPGHF